MTNPIPQLLSSQRDFSGGELDVEMKRRDDLPIYRAGGRQMKDWRIRNSGTLEQRPGRRALYPQTGRVDQVAISSTDVFAFCFGADGSLKIRNSVDVVVASKPAGTYTWTQATVRYIVWTKVNVSAVRTDVVITFLGTLPQIASYSVVGTWTFSDLTFAADGSGHPLMPFLRIAAQGATATPSATGAAGAAITLVFSSPVLIAAHLGAIFRLATRRVQVTHVTDEAHANVTCLDALLKTQSLTLAAPDGAIIAGVEGFQLGQIVEGSVSGATGEVVGIDLATPAIAVQLTTFSSGFLVSAAGPPVINELVIGASAKSKVTAVVDIAPLPLVSWDEQIISAARGWPASCAVDAGRLIFCDLPSTPEAVLWSATNQPYNFSIGANPSDAICELVAGKPRVYHVAPWIDELIFTDAGIYFVPINITNPLKPGSVTFQKISPEASSQSKPAFTSDGYLFISAGRNAIKVVSPAGAAFSTKPYTVTDLTAYHRHLFSAIPITIAVSIGDGVEPERYVYVVNNDGSLIVGRYESGNDAGKWVGWLPWTGSGISLWVSALHSDVRMVTTYSAATIAEVLDSGQYLDAAIAINSPPALLAPNVLLGPFQWLPSTTVQLIDGVTPLGLHNVDASGFVLPNFMGENLSSASLIGGKPYTPTFEPFVPNAQPGEDKKQRTIRRSLGRVIVSVMNSTGFVIASLYSGPAGPGRPAQGSVMKSLRIPPWQSGDNVALPPLLREETQRQRFSGRSPDQRVAIYKDVPGPIKLIEVAIEASV